MTELSGGGTRFVFMSLRILTSKGVKCTISTDYLLNHSDSTGHFGAGQEQGLPLAKMAHGCAHVRAAAAAVVQLHNYEFAMSEVEGRE